jgi:hypothetical protein
MNGALIKGIKFRLADDAFSSGSFSFQLVFTGFSPGFFVLLEISQHSPSF